MGGPPPAHLAGDGGDHNQFAVVEGKLLSFFPHARTDFEIAVSF